ncbi:MAG: hypothetical protein DRJ26_03645 [Candidatus Methanomethylicota archaeon]|uniref:Uncharacterized protein n=1 Tax=Thermoproteota archaeon TaxID=2056631 RepID=A0A497F1L4_9CREN|nr:MAG: hypothetical protein DRJ26_03645 [Candidatus Verstraetearchaeota archaeon]
MSKKERIPFRVKMANGSIETVYAYSEKQAMFLASRLGKRPIRVVGILSQEVVEKKEEEEMKANGERLLKELLMKLENSLKNRKYLEAVKCQVDLHKAIAEGKIAWSNELEQKYELFKYW